VLTYRGHVTSLIGRDRLIPHRPFPIGGPLKPRFLSLTVSETFNGECGVMVDMNLIRPLYKGQGHSFWYNIYDFL